MPKIVVKMSIGTFTDIATEEESDPSYMYVISDGYHFIGAMIRDKNNFNAGAPCPGIEGSSGKTMRADRRQDSELPKPSESKCPGRIETLLSVFDRWETCFISLDGGFSRERIFQLKLNPENGLFLEIIDDKSEKVSIVQED